MQDRWIFKFSNFFLNFVAALSLLGGVLFAGFFLFKGLVPADKLAGGEYVPITLGSSLIVALVVIYLLIYSYIFMLLGKILKTLRESKRLQADSIPWFSKIANGFLALFVADIFVFPLIEQLGIIGSADFEKLLGGNSEPGWLDLWFPEFGGMAAFIMYLLFFFVKSYLAHHFQVKEELAKVKEEQELTI